MKITVLCLCLGLAGSALAQAPASAPKPAARPATAAHPTSHHMTTDPALLHPDTLKAKAPETFQVTFHTTKGDFVVDVTRSWAPLGADRFYNLVKHGFFNGAPFFRVVPGFVVQFGLGANPAVNKVWADADIKDDPVTQHNVPGSLVFATAGPNTRTTQLFINLGDNSSSLDRQGFAPFGKVISGMDVVQKIYPGYGERPDQGMLTSQGSAYFSKAFPNLDLINSTTITSPAGATGGGTATHHAAPSSSSKPQ